MDFEEIPNASEDEMPSSPPAVPPPAPFGGNDNLNYDNIYADAGNDNVLPDPEPQQEDALT
jgi:hypothetical protein